MKSKCFLNDNYEVIKLCDINNFNEAVSSFFDKSWIQITLSEKLILTEDKPSIKTIFKIYVDIKINSSKLIEAISSNDIKSVGGLKLTGKTLLVSGEVLQNIIYISDTASNSMHSFKFNTPFTAYIVVEEDVDIENDAYCVYPCIEDVFLKPLDGRTINKNINLFLFAHKTTETPIIPNIPNIFVFKTDDGSQEISRVEFDVVNLMLIVTSTGTNYSSIAGNTAFKFELLNADGTSKVTGNILSNGNANDFKNALNSQSFSFGDFIEVTYLKAERVVLEHYPDQGDTYTMATNVRKERFVITENGITPLLVPNKIVIKSKKNKPVLTIGFNNTRERFVVSSTGVVPDTSSIDDYFTLIHKGGYTQDKRRVILKSNEDGGNFKNLLNSMPYESRKDIITLIYKDKSKVEILDYPAKGDVFKPTNDFNSFLIGRTTLTNLSFDSKIKIINENNEEMMSIYFFKPSFPSTPIAVTLVTTSTNKVATTTGRITDVYVWYLHYQDDSVTHSEKIFEQGTAVAVASALNGTHTSVPPNTNRSFLRLSSSFNNKIIITNYRGQEEYAIGFGPEFLEIQSDALVPHDLGYNKIILKNRDNSTVLTLYFDKVADDILYLQLYSTGVVNRDTASFTFKITDPSERNVKVEGTINRGETVDDIQNLDFIYESNITNQFDIGDKLILEYSDKTLVEIFDFPFITPPYNPTANNSQKFTIAQNGLRPI